METLKAIDRKRLGRHRRVDRFRSSGLRARDLFRRVSLTVALLGVALNLSACASRSAGTRATRPKTSTTIPPTTVPEPLACPAPPKAAITTTSGPTFGIKGLTTIEGTVTNPAASPIAWDMVVEASYPSATGQSESEPYSADEGPPSYASSGGARAAPGNSTVEWYAPVEDDSGTSSSLPSVTGLTFGWAYVDPGLADCDYIPASMSNTTTPDEWSPVATTADAEAEWELWQQDNP